MEEQKRKIEEIEMEKMRYLGKFKKVNGAKNKETIKTITLSLTTASQRMSLQSNRAEHKQQRP